MSRYFGTTSVLAGTRAGVLAGMLAVVAGAVVAAPVMAQSDSGSRQSQKQDSSKDKNAELSQQIEIMRLVLAKKINTSLSDLTKQITDEYKKAQGADKEGSADQDKSEDSTSSAAAKNGDNDEDSADPSAEAISIAAAPTATAGGRSASGDPTNRMYYALTAAAPRALSYSGMFSNDSIYTSYTRGYYANGIGVLYSTEANIPVKPIEKSKEAGEEVKPNKADKSEDLWESTADQVNRNDGDHVLGDILARVDRGDKDSPKFEFDDRYINALTDAVFDTIGTYGEKLTQMQGQDSFVIAIRLSASYRVDALRPARESVYRKAGSGRAVVATPNGTSVTSDEDGDSIVTVGKAHESGSSNGVSTWSTNSTESGSNPYVFYTTLGGLAAGSVHDQQLVIQIPRSAVDALMKGQIDKSAFQHRATITRF